MHEAPEVEDYLQLMSGLLALGIFVIALVSWRRRPTARTLLVTGAFGLLVVRGAFLSAADFVLGHGPGDALERIAPVLEAAFLLLVTAAFLKN